MNEVLKDFVERLKPNERIIFECDKRPHDECVFITFKNVEEDTNVKYAIPLLEIKIATYDIISRVLDNGLYELRHRKG